MDGVRVEEKVDVVKTDDGGSTGASEHRNRAGDATVLDSGGYASSLEVDKYSQLATDDWGEKVVLKLFN